MSKHKDVLKEEQNISPSALELDYLERIAIALEKIADLKEKDFNRG